MKVVFLFILSLSAAGIAGRGRAEAKPPESIEAMMKKRGAVDRKKYRSLSLPNSLRAVLISDPDAPQCSASMNVGVGNMADPPDALGMAHYLEHVLFMGTKKFPVTGEYSEYIERNQGMTNAYTSTQDTNYQFQINAAAFEGAVDRFAQFFVAPKFDAGFLEKEKNAVQSEYDKNIQNDGWREFQMLKGVLRAGHPASQFSIGSLDTLKGATREKVLAFYDQHYSANIMTLALYCNSNLDALEGMTKKYFSGVPNKDLKKIEYSGDLIDPATLPLKVSFKPVKEERKLSFAYVLPPTKPYFLTKPAKIIQYLLGREGQGSLLADLKARGWAVSLSAGGFEENNATFFSTDIELTPEGSKNADAVSDLYFSYMNLLRREGYPRHIFELQNTMMGNQYVFAETEAPVSLAIYYASSLADHPGDRIDANLMLLPEYSPDDFRKFLDLMTPDKVVVFLSAPEVKTDAKEPFFGIEYRKEKIPEKAWQNWARQPVAPVFRYPQHNRYLPTDLGMLPPSKAQVPEQLAGEPGQRLWFLNDGRFPVPKGQIAVLLATPAAGVDVDGNVKTELWVRLLNDHLTAWYDELAEVGMEAGFTMQPNGVLLRVGGFSQHLTAVLAEGVRQASGFIPDEGRFRVIKETMVRELENLDFADPFRLALENLRALEQKSLFRYPERLASLKKVGFAAAKAHRQELFGALGVQALAYGNLGRDPVAAAVNGVFRDFAVKTRLPFERQPGEVFLTGGKGTHLALVSETKNNNSAWASKVVFGRKSAAADASATVLAALWEPKFFSDLRDKKQLGYVVRATSSLAGKSSGFLFLLQSQQYSSNQLAEHARSWLGEQLQALNSLDDATFAQLKEAAIEKLRQRESNIGERFERLWEEIRLSEADFNYRPALIAALQALEKKEFVNYVNGVFSDRESMVNSSYIAPRGQKRPVAEKNETAVTDLETAKRGMKPI